MTTPAFREPGRRDRNFRTPAEIARRLDRLDRIGRRCDYDSRRCVNNAATWRLSVRDLDPDGAPGNPYNVLTCSRHKKHWVLGTTRYQVVSEQKLPPQDTDKA